MRSFFIIHFYFIFFVFVFIVRFQRLDRDFHRFSIECQFDRVMQKVDSTVYVPGSKPTHIFKVIPSPHSVAEEKFRKHLIGNGSTLFAYHGSKVESFHSIMNYGLQQHLCKVKSIQLFRATFVSNQQ